MSKYNIFKISIKLSITKNYLKSMLNFYHRKQYKNILAFVFISARLCKIISKYLIKA